MKNRHVIPVLAGAGIAALGLLLLGAVPLLELALENHVNQLIGLSLVAFFVVISYEDWKDARREQLNQSHRRPSV